MAGFSSFNLIDIQPRIITGRKISNSKKDGDQFTSQTASARIRSGTDHFSDNAMDVDTVEHQPPVRSIILQDESK